MTDIIDNAGGHRQVRYHDEADGTYSESVAAHLRGWDSTAGQMVRLLVDHATGGLITSGGASGGGAATIADGADVAEGTTTDVACLSSANTVIGILKAIKAAITGTLTVATHAVTQSGTWTVGLSSNTPDVTDRAARLLGHVTVDSAPTTAVTGTFFQATQPVSLATAPTTPVTGTFFQATQPVSAASLPLPTGAAVATGQSTVKAASTLAAAADTSQVIQQSPMRGDASISVGTTISTANAGVTLTVSAAGAGLFHYITSIEIVATNPTVTAIAAAATNLAWTTTNLNGLAWNTGTLLAAGAEKVVTRMSPATPIKSAAANTNSTIVAPAVGTGGLCRIQVTYYTAP